MDGPRQGMDRTGIRKLIAQSSKIGLQGAKRSPCLGGLRAPLKLSCKLSTYMSPPSTGFLRLEFLWPVWAQRKPSGWDGSGTRLD